MVVPQIGWLMRENPNLTWIIWRYLHLWNPPYGMIYTFNVGPLIRMVFKAQLKLREPKKHVTKQLMEL
jgi:hypothetical protein